MQPTWLSHIEEQYIKATHTKTNNNLFFDSNNKEFIDRIHSIEGIVLLKAYIATTHSTNCIIILRFNEKMSYFIQEAIYSTKEIHTQLEIDWDSRILYNVFGRDKMLSCTVLSNTCSFDYFETLLKNLDV